MTHKLYHASQGDDHVEVPLRVPRSALTVVQAPPTHVSQKTSEREIGIPRGAFLELARDFARDGGEVLSAGKLRIVAREAFLEWLRRRSPRVATPSSETSGLLDELGLRVLPGGRR
jgi:hypothetical protein